MTVRNLEIHSAFSDVNLVYDESNQSIMQKMDIHAARANVLIDNIEKARVKLVTIKNDMGNTKISFGSNSTLYSTVYIQAGVGNCTISVDENHPVKIIVKRGMFAGMEIGDEFTQIEKNVFVNRAYRSDHPAEATKIICNVDLGDINLVKN